MNIFKKILISLLIIIIALGIGIGAFIVKESYFTKKVAAPTSIPDLNITVSPAPTVTEDPVVNYVKTNDKGINLRQEPNKASALIASLDKDIVLQLVYSDADWTSVIYEGQTVYVKTEYVDSFEPVVEPQKIGNGKTIVIDPGYQAIENTGMEAVGPNLGFEVKRVSIGTVGVSTHRNAYEICLELAIKLKAGLEASGYTVVLTRDNNETDISNSSRAAIANESNASAFISLRTGASHDSSIKGIMTLCMSSSNTDCSAIYSNSYRLASIIGNSTASACNTINTGLMQTDIESLLNYSKIPVTILQMGYQTNTEEDKLLSDPEYQDKLIQGILSGLDTYFNK